MISSNGDYMKYLSMIRLVINSIKSSLVSMKDLKMTSLMVWSMKTHCGNNMDLYWAIHMGLQFDTLKDINMVSLMLYTMKNYPFFCWMYHVGRERIFLVVILSNYDVDIVGDVVIEFWEKSGCLPWSRKSVFS